MRISDWSSDVCSSDLGMNFMHAWHRPDSADMRRIGSDISPGASCCPANAWSACSKMVLPSLKSASSPPATCITAKSPARESLLALAGYLGEDRRSVGEGKGVSGQVAHGGRS